MKKRAGCLWLLASIILALAAGGLAFSAMLRATSAQSVEETEPRADVVIVAQSVPRRTRVEADDLKTVSMPVGSIPADAVRDTESAVGQVTLDPLLAGEILLSPRVADIDQRGPQVAFESEAGKVIMAWPTGDLMTRINILKPGDQVDILVSYEVKNPDGPSAGGRSSGTSNTASAEASSQTGDSNQADEVVYTFTGLQRATISAVVMPREAFQGDSVDPKARPEALLIALDPQDALILKHLRDTEAMFDIVLRAPEDDTEFETSPVEQREIIDRYELGVEGAEDD